MAAKTATHKSVPRVTLLIIRERIKHLSQSSLFSVMFAGECEGAVKVHITPKDDCAALPSFEIWQAVKDILDYILDGLKFTRDVRQSRIFCNCTLEMA